MVRTGLSSGRSGGEQCSEPSAKTLKYRLPLRRSGVSVDSHRLTGIQECETNAVRGSQKASFSPILRAWALIAATVFFVLIGSGTAAACSCLEPVERQVALDWISREEVAFKGTVVRTFPGVTEYEVHDVFAGDVAKRVLVSSPYAGSSCDPGSPPRGQVSYFIGTSKSGIVSAANSSSCDYAILGISNASSDATDNLFQEALGPAEPPRSTVQSRVLGLAEWPLTWLADRRVQVVIALAAALSYLIHFYRSRYGSPAHRP